MRRLAEYVRVLAIFWVFCLVINHIFDVLDDPAFDDERTELEIVIFDVDETEAAVNGR